MQSSVNPCGDGQREGILSRDLIPVAEAAAALGIPEKRLIGFILRNELRDPIGGWLDGGMAVYGWSCRTLAERMAAAGDSAGVSP